MTDFPRCPQCGKVFSSTPSAARRGARNLTRNSRNEKRAYTAKRCKHLGCPNPGYIVASSELVNKRIRRHLMHEQHEREAFEAEVTETAAAIYQDVLDYATDPEDFFPYLADAYSVEIANAVIAEIKGALE